jgi:pimeloyl-ACP methyl ester carboxylesterase
MNYYLNQNLLMIIFYLKIFSLIQWKHGELNLKLIILCAHSFECYISINYYNKYLNNVKSLILVE